MKLKILTTFILILFCSCRNEAGTTRERVSGDNAAADTELYYGFDADGKETNCVKFNEMTSCAEIFKPVSMYKKVCEDAGETSFQCTCYDYLCSAKVEFNVEDYE